MTLEWLEFWVELPQRMARILGRVALTDGSNSALSRLNRLLEFWVELTQRMAGILGRVTLTGGSNSWSSCLKGWLDCELPFIFLISSFGFNGFGVHSLLFNFADFLQFFICRISLINLFCLPYLGYKFLLARY